MCLFFLNFRRTSPSTLLPLCVVYNFHHRDPVNTKDLDIQQVQNWKEEKLITTLFQNAADTTHKHSLRLTIILFHQKSKIVFIFLSTASEFFFFFFHFQPIIANTESE